MHVDAVAVEFRNAAMAVAHELAKADIGDNDQLRKLSFERPDGTLHDAIRGIGLRSLLILVRRDAEE